MKLYRIDWTDTNLDDRITWTGSQKEADDKLPSIRRGAVAEPHVMVVNLPTDKHQLLAWLNTHLNRDPLHD